MRIFHSHIIKNITTLVVIFFLLLPSASSFAHSTEKHDYSEQCENKSDTHIHEKELDCCLGYVTLLNPAVFNTVKDIFFTKYQDILGKTTHTQAIYISLYHTTESRGPPPVC